MLAAPSASGHSRSTSEKSGFEPLDVKDLHVNDFDLKYTGTAKLVQPKMVQPAVPD